MPRPGEVAMTLSLAVAAIAAGCAVYGYVGLADARRASTSNVAVQEEWLAMQSEPVGEPLRVANPFDSTEIFEFPAGTSEADAHEAIAGFLIERATRRGVAHDRRHTGPKS
jgi:hypothetical protein